MLKCVSSVPRPSQVPVETRQTERTVPTCLAALWWISFHGTSNVVELAKAFIRSRGL